MSAPNTRTDVVIRAYGPGQVTPLVDTRAASYGHGPHKNSPIRPTRSKLTADAARLLADGSTYGRELARSLRQEPLFTRPQS